MKTLTEAQVLKLNPKVYTGKTQFPVYDWFEATRSGSMYSIRSGLCHADGETKSPYHFSVTKLGRGAKIRCLEEFTKWWSYVNSQPYNAVMTYPTKYKQGFTTEEVAELCLELKVSRENFNKKFGINTCMSLDGNTIMYHSDVLRTFRLVMEDRELTMYEFD